MTSSLTDAIRSKAFELGFTSVGVARAEAIPEESARLREWLAKGYHGTMSWMERNTGKRSDPREILSGARSVLVAAMNYQTDCVHSGDPAEGKISRYAWGTDYHEIMAGMLRELLAYIVELSPGAEGRLYVDTGPVMEKAWAQRAGIGWVAKHTNVITQTHGSWVFLGELILDIELAYDEPAPDHCGSCTLCIEACPTGAIVEPYMLDSNRCISYLTIEHRGPLPDDLVPSFEGWLYGCDICQDVCPWNHKFSRPSAVAGFAPREGETSLGLAAVQSMGQEAFQERFRHSPIKRTKLEGLRRNAGALLDARSPSEAG